MDNFHVYRDTLARTGGEIYIGVVGPVRTGKSTFIKRFMELLVLPGLAEGSLKEQTRDELPQSAAGKTIMTTEPKFIPKEAADFVLEDGTEAKVRLIDCVGFMVQGAAGHEENGAERLVRTPWYDYEIPFTQAAEIGTRKVIRDHSTIGLAVTADGSFGDLARGDYLDAERQTVGELKEIGKPFLVLLNSARPYAEETKKLAAQMEQEYGAAVLPVNCEQLKKADIERILDRVLKEFPVTEIDFSVPKWLELLPASHPLKAEAIERAREVLEHTGQMKDVMAAAAGGGEDGSGTGGRDKNPAGAGNEIGGRKDAGSAASGAGGSGGDGCGTLTVTVEKMEMADGTVSMKLSFADDCYYRVLSEYSAFPVHDEYELFSGLRELSGLKAEYEKVKNALAQVRQSGYGIVMPDKEEITLDEPQLIKHGTKYGVKIHAQAPSINLIKAQIETEIAPIVGNEQQAKDLIEYIRQNAQTENGVWETNIFGKSVEQIVEDGMGTKIAQMTDECREKLQGALQRIINESSGGIICIII